MKDMGIATLTATPQRAVLAKEPGASAPRPEPQNLDPQNEVLTKHETPFFAVLGEASHRSCVCFELYARRGVFTVAG